MTKYNKIIFFNRYHSGDIFVSRGFIKYILSLDLAEEYYYQHKCDPKLLQDFPQITSLRPERHDCPKSTDTDKYIHAWYMMSSHWNSHGPTYTSLYHIFKSYVENVFKLPFNVDKSTLLPQIDFSYFKVNHIKDYLESSPYNTKILISNGDCMSTQASNFDLNPTIQYLATTYPNALFLVTNKEDIPINLPNVVYTSNIIKAESNDLIENAYISRYCDVIVGRSSGTYTYSMLKENFEDPTKTFVCCVNSAHAVLGKWAPPDIVKAKTITVTEQSCDAVSKAVNTHIGGKDV